MAVVSSNLVTQAPKVFKKQIAVSSPISGKLKPLSAFEHIPTQTGFLGPGACIELSGSKVIAPFSAKVESLPLTGYEVVLRAANGLRMWIKIGSSKSSLMGQRCVLQTRVGKVVRSGHTIMLLDPYWMRQHQHNTDCAVTFINGSKLKAIMPSSAKSLVAGEDRLFTLFL